MPSARICAKLRCVAALRHICTFMAGAMASGHLTGSRANTKFVSKSSLMPWAIFAMTLAVHGAISMASASRLRLMWAILLSAPARLSHSESYTGSPASVARVNGVMNSFAPSVMTTDTRRPCLRSKRTSSADLYAAMPPLIPKRMCFMGCLDQ